MGLFGAGCLIANPARRRAGWILLATIVAVAATARLGFWQLDRAARKIALAADMQARGALAPLDGAALARTPAAAAAQFHRPAVLHGRWLAEATVYLDNRQMNGLPGFFVVTPLQLEGRDEAVAVQRGWVPRNFAERTALPPLSTPAGTVTVAGSIAPPPARLYEFQGGASGPIRQNLDLDAYGRELRIRLLPLSVLQTGPGTPPDGLRRDWPAPAADVQKHYGYAFQWFALSALMTGLYVWFQLVRPRR